MGGQSKIRSIHSGGGFNATLAARLKSVELPAQTRCCECNKSRAIRYFSEGQLKLLREGIVSRQVKDPTGPWVKCKDCTGKQVTELRCMTCDKWMGLDQFAKAQRRNGEYARCMNCVADHLEFPTLNDKTAGQDEIDNLGGDDFSDEGSTADTNVNTCNTDQSGVRLPPSSTDNLNAQTLRSLNQSSLSGHSKPNDPRTQSAITGWQATALGGGLGEAHKFTAYDAKGQAHARTQAPSTVDQSEYDDSEESFDEPKYSPRAERDARANFAKVKAQGGKNIHRPAPNGAGRHVAGYDDSDEEPESGEEFAL